MKASGHVYTSVALPHGESKQKEAKEENELKAKEGNTHKHIMQT
jgi:hypothetical protein